MRSGGDVERAPGLSLIGEVPTAHAMLKVASEVRPDVVVLNIRTLDGTELEDSITRLGSCTVIVLRSEGSAVGFADAPRAEVDTFADLDALGDDLPEMVSIIKRGCAVLLLTNRVQSDLLSSIDGKPAVGLLAS